MRSSVAILGILLALAAGPSVFAQTTPEAQEAPAPSAMRPGRQISLTHVKDTFFSYVLGIVLTGRDVDIDNTQMRDILTEFQTKLKFPFDLVHRVMQRNDMDNGDRTISIVFSGDVIIPIPFSFLGYHPGTLRSTQTVNFRVLRSSYTDPQYPSVYTPVYDLTLAQGDILIDIDDWLVYLLSNVLDKLQVRHIVFFSYDGVWIGLLEGEGKVFHRDMREYFDFTNNKIIYPIPEKLDAMGKAFIGASPSLVSR
ncbi:MAG TPA: hypothetical protein VL354_10605 [Spirochaetia bacterium]|nr:hypothetical protein [Spirochaetia bacterium]